METTYSHFAVTAAICLLLCGCGPKEYTPEQGWADDCHHYDHNEDFKDCMEREEAEYMDQPRRQAEEAKQERIRSKKEQLAADTAQCKEYGFTKGTTDFATCKMKLDQARQSQEEEDKIARQQQETARHGQDLQRAAIGAAMLLTTCYTNGGVTHCY